MEQAFMAYKSKKNLSDKDFMEYDARTWSNARAALLQSSTTLERKISKVLSKIAGIHISDQFDYITDSSPHTAIAWCCVEMVLNVAAVSGTPDCNCS